MNVWGKRSQEADVPDPLLVGEVQSKRFKVGNAPTDFELPLERSGTDGYVLTAQANGGTAWLPGGGVTDPLIVNSATVNVSLTSNGTATLHGAQFTDAIFGTDATFTENVNANIVAGQSAEFDDTVFGTTEVIGASLKVGTPSNPVYTLPASAGTVNQVITADTNGNTSWRSPAAVDPLTVANATVTNSLTSNGLTTLSGGANVTGAISAQAATFNGNVQVSQAISCLNNITATGTVQGATVQGTTLIGSTIAAGTSTNRVYTLPTTAPATNQVIVSNADGSSSWREYRDVDVKHRVINRPCWCTCRLH